MQVCVFCTEQTLRTFNTESLCFVDNFATAVVTTTWVTLGVFIRECAAECGEDRRASEVFGSNELKAVTLAIEFAQEDVGDLWIERGALVAEEARAYAERRAARTPAPS
mgnify:CR=1 FL=1